MRRALKVVMENGRDTADVILLYLKLVLDRFLLHPSEGNIHRSSYSSTLLYEQLVDCLNKP